MTFDETTIYINPTKRPGQPHHSNSALDQYQQMSCLHRRPNPVLGVEIGAYIIHAFDGDSHRVFRCRHGHGLEPRIFLVHHSETLGISTFDWSE